MTSRSLPRLRRLCNALPKTKHDRQFESLSALQQLLAFAVTTGVVLAVPALLVDAPEAHATIGIALGFGVLYNVTALLARYNRR